MKRLTNPVECHQITDKNLEHFTFNVEEWLADDRNYALVCGDNAGFAEFKSPGTYYVHFCYNTARGREAINLASNMLKDLVNAKPVKIILGCIDVHNKKARWLIRQLGFKSAGLVESLNGVDEIFYLPSKEV